MKKFSYTLLAVAIASVSIADDFADVFSDEVFADDPFADIDTTEIETNDSPWSLNHELSLQSISNINSERTNAVEERYSGLTSLRLSYRPDVEYQVNDALELKADVSVSGDAIFALRNNAVWHEDDRQAREFQFDVHSLLMKYRANQWQWSTGVQTVTLGLADALSVANVLQAQNLQVPGTSDIDDAQKPAWVSMVNGSLASVRLKFGVVHQHTVNDLPLSGTDFDVADPQSGFTLNQMLGSAGLSLEAEPLAVANMGGFVSVSGVLGRLDWQANAVSQLSHSPVVEFQVIGMGPSPKAIHYPREQTYSVASSLVAGAFLWKLEAALTDGMQAQAFASNGMMPGDLVSFQRASGTLGFDFNHSQLGRLVAEVQLGQILDYDALNLMKTDEQSARFALMYSRSFMREQLTMNAQLMGFDIDASGGRLQGVGVDYDFSDQLMGQFKLVDYVDGNYQFMQGADDRDRVIATLTYRF